MVLDSSVSASRLASASLVGAMVLAFATCLPSAEVIRLKSPRPLHVAYILENDEAFPEELKEDISALLTARNLLPQPFNLDAATTLSQNRLAVLSGNAPTDALLVEAQAVYYSQLNGQMRWVVSGKVSLRAASGEIFDADFDYPVFLRRVNQGADDALLAARRSVTGAVTAVVDGFLAGERAALGAAVAAGPAGRSDATYFVLVDRYQNGDADNDRTGDVGASPDVKDDPAAFFGGDLVGVENDLDRLDGLGVQSIWLSPVYAMRTEKVGAYGAFHGYWVDDFARVEPRFGGDDALASLKDAADERGMDLMLDFVVNHAGYDTTLTTAHPEYFQNRGDVKVLAAAGEADAVTDGDVSGLPDFAQENERVARFLIDTHTEWVRRYEPRRIRIDAAKHMRPAFLKRFNDAMRAASEKPLEVVGEYWDGNAAALAETAHAAGFDQVFDFPLYYAMVRGVCPTKKDGPGDLRAVAAALTLSRIYPRGPRSLKTFVDNHDLPRIASVCGAVSGKVRTALAMMLLARGEPVLTYGTEVPLTGMTEPANRAPMVFKSATDQDAPSGGTPGDTSGDNAYALEGDIAALLKVRAAHPDLASAPTEVLRAERDVLVLDRKLAAGTVRTLIAKGETARAAVGSDATALYLAPGCTLEGGVLTAEPPSVCAVLLPKKAGAETGARCTTREVAMSITGAPSRGDIYVVGAAPEIGGWKLSRGALSASTSDGARRVTLRLPCAQVLEYKLVHVGADKVQTWQSGPNRTVFVPGDEGGMLSARADWTDDISPRPAAPASSPLPSGDDTDNDGDDDDAEDGDDDGDEDDANDSAANDEDG